MDTGEQVETKQAEAQQRIETQAKGDAQALSKLEFQARAAANAANVAPQRVTPPPPVSKRTAEVRIGRLQPFWVGADRLDPQRADLRTPCQLYNLDAVAYESLGETSRALTAYKRALELAPGDATVLRMPPTGGVPLLVVPAPPPGSVFNPVSPDTGVPATVRGRVETCRELGIGFVSYSPLGRGFLTGRLTSTDELAPVVFEARFARNGRGAPDVVAPPLKAQSPTARKPFA